MNPNRVFGTFSQARCVLIRDVVRHFHLPTTAFDVCLTLFRLGLLSFVFNLDGLVFSVCSALD